MIFDPRAPWSREDIAEYLGVTPEYVDRIKHKLPPAKYVGRLPRWKAGEVMECWESGALSHRSPNRPEDRANA